MAKKSKGDEFFMEDFFEKNSFKTAVDIAREQANYRVYSTGCLMLDCAIGEADPIKGNMGIPQRTIVEIFGRNSSLKTGLYEQLAKNILLDDPENIVMVFYSEESDMDRWKSIGVTDEMQKRIYTLGCFEGDANFIETAEKQLDRIKVAVKDPRVKLVAIDSIKAMCAARQIHTETGQEKSLADSEKLALRASLVGEFIRDFKMNNKRAILFMTNQETDKFNLPGQTHTNPKYTFQTPGGRTMEFECQLRIRSVTRPLETEVHDLTGAKYVYGWQPSFNIIKNKFCNSSTGRVAVAEFLFDPPGFDKVQAAFAMGSYLTKRGFISPEEGIVEAAAGYFTIVGEKVRGASVAKEFLASRPELIEFLESKIYEHAEDLYKFPGKPKNTGSIEEIF